MANKIRKMHIRRDDIVVLRTGDYRDKWTVKEDREGNERNRTRRTGKVIAVSPEEGKVIVQGINVVSKHAKPRKQGDPSGILSVESAIYVDKVQLYCSSCDTGVRVRRKITVDTVDGKKRRTVKRICVKCDKEI